MLSIFELLATNLSISGGLPGDEGLVFPRLTHCLYLPYRCVVGLHAEECWTGNKLFAVPQESAVLEATVMHLQQGY